MRPEELGAWQALLQEEFEKPYWRTLAERVDAAYAASTVYPPREELFAAFRMTPPEAVRPSLRNILTELQADCGVTPPESGDLTAWARQGVFLLNSSLSVEAGKAASHQAFGWQTFTDAAVRAVAVLPQPVAFVLWGGHAQKKAALAADSPYPRLVLQAPHPSPLSAYRGFFGSRPFSKINAFLESAGSRAIDWQL